MTRACVELYKRKFAVQTPCIINQWHTQKLANGGEAKLLRGRPIGFLLVFPTNLKKFYTFERGMAQWPCERSCVQYSA